MERDMASLIADKNLPVHDPDEDFSDIYAEFDVIDPDLDDDDDEDDEES